MQRTSPKLLRKFSMGNKGRPFRVAVLGQNGVGKSALTVRFITRRFIGDYDPYLEKVYSCNRAIDGDTVTVEVLDTAGQDESLRLEQNIKWAEAYILMYAVTDRCSFNECSRLKFLINSYTKRQRRTSVNASEGGLQVPVALVGNQTDQSHDRMISEEEGRLKGAELSCVGFYEISVRESIEDVISIFESLYLYCRRPKKFKSKLNGIADPTAATSETSQSALPAVLPQRDRRRALQTIS